MIFLIIQGKFWVDVLTRTWFYGKHHSTFPRYKTNDCPNSFDCLLQVMNRSHRSFAMQLRISLSATLGLMWLIHTSFMQQPQWIQTLQHCSSPEVVVLLTSCWHCETSRRGMWNKWHMEFYQTACFGSEFGIVRTNSRNEVTFRKTLRSQHIRIVCTVHQNVKLMMAGGHIGELPADEDNAPLTHYRHCLSGVQCNPSQRTTDTLSPLSIRGTV